jgi:Na+/H+ antiporter NhaC
MEGKWRAKRIKSLAVNAGLSFLQGVVIFADSAAA